MAEIRIEGNPAALGFDHLYLVFVDDSCSEFVIRGGPTFDIPPFGAILVEDGSPIGDSEDNRPASAP